MKSHFSRFLIVFAIVGLSTYAYVRKPPPLGLDLAGGSSLTYQAASAEGELTADRLKRVIDVVDKRLNGMGVSEISIVPTQQNEIVIELPGRTAEQIKDIKSLVERNGTLEFRIQAEASEERKWRELKDAQDVKPPADFAWVPHKDSTAAMLVKTPERPLQSELNKLTKRKKEELRGTGLADASPEFAAAMKAFEETDEFKNAQRAYEEKKREEVFVGDDLVKTEIQHQPGQIVVFFSFKDERKPWFGQFTEKHQGENMAIILDGKVDSAPVIKSKLPGEGIIEGGRGATGFSETEAKALAIVLESGSTGVTLSLSREESLGPNLGEVAIRHGVLSVIVGFALVVLLMVFYYRMPGMVANGALLLNLVILMGFMAFMRAAVTLPGIAGVVLTLGMAVDANVLIFERYREERHRGKPVREALAAGYDRAFSAVVDTHVTTILTAIVLIVLGTGSVKGFGVSLTVGLVASFFTAFYVTRWIFEWAIEKGIATNLVLGPDKKTPTLDYMRHRKWFTGPSFVLMILGAIAYFVRDEYDMRDLEFVGGQEAVVQLSKPISPDEADRLLKADKRYEEASVVTLANKAGAAEPGKTDSFRFRAKAENPKKGEEFIDYVAVAFKGLLVPPPISDVNVEPLKTGGASATLALHAVGDTGDPANFEKALAATGLTDVSVKKDAAATGVLNLCVTDVASTASAETVKTRVAEAVKKVQPKITLSDPFPSKSFLDKGRAQDLYRSAIWAILVSLVIQVVYIRIRYSNYVYGVAAVIAVAHDVPIALGAVAVCDAMGWVYAKVNLVLIAAFLTMIGFTMNDKIVVYDRIRENLGKRKAILSTITNEAVNQTLVRSIRTSMTVFVVVLVQFLFSRGTGSVLEGFAFVMIVGVVSGTYSSIFIAGPLLLFLPVYGRKLSARPRLTAAMAVATFVGIVMTLTAPSGSPRMWIGLALAFNMAVHFLAYFFPWLGHPDPDSFVREDVESDEKALPTAKPGI